jgi:beta-galactosidase
MTRAPTKRQAFHTAKRYQGQAFLYGVCYYPEHWPPEQWAGDFTRMRDLGMNTVRMGESAWSVWEPQEDHFSFELFDAAIALAAEQGLKVILGTPTYAPPAWLTERYPEVLRADFFGHAMQHGSRRHYNYTSPVYLERCKRVVSALATHYGHDERVIGWQIDNELNCHMTESFAESDHAAFRVWLEQRYGSLEVLNDAWGTVFWSQTYTAWSQLSLPRPTTTYHNPGHLLDFLRFTSDTAVKFSQFQADILRTTTVGQFVTHNGLFDNLDNFDLTETLDFMSFDNYPSFFADLTAFPPHFRDRIAGVNLSKTRGFSSKFLILEQQAGPGGQSGSMLLPGRSDKLLVTPKPGQVRLWAWHAAAHGADGIMFFRWRTLPFGAEILWHGLYHYGDTPSWRVREAQQLGAEFGRLENRLLGSEVRAKAAVLYDYDNLSNTQIDSVLGLAQRTQERALYRALSERHLTPDFLMPGCWGEPGVLEAYPVVFYPNAQLLDSADAQRLTRYVEGGGTLILGVRSGYRDRLGRAHRLPFPGVLRDLCGIEVVEFSRVGLDEQASFAFTSSEALEAPTFLEVLEPREASAEVLATHVEGSFGGHAALTLTRRGKGRVIYCGVLLTVESVARLLETLEIADPTQVWANVPAEVEVLERVGDAGSWTLLLNFSPVPQIITLKQMVRDLLNEAVLEGDVELPPYGVLALEG